MSLFEELKRRNVFRVGIAYVITAWLILQVSDIVLDNISAPGWLMQAIMLVLAVGLPLALIFAWAFELTPEGLKKEKDVDRTQSITHQTGHKLDRTIIAILVLALGYFAWDKFSSPDDNAVPDPSAVIPANAGIQSEDNETANGNALTNAAQRSIAVLPFVDMSPAKDNEYFTDGLTEELLNILAQIKSLQVAGRTSSFAFKDKTEDLREIGSKLNVNTLLEGSVRKDDKNQRIRVTVQLINVEDGYHIWSDTYDRDLEDIFAIQEDIARQVAEALKINLLGEEENQFTARASTGMNAYELYLQGLQALNLYTFDDLRRAENLFQQSLAVDPGYLPTKLALAKTWVDLAETGALQAPQAREKATPLLNEVLLVEPGNGEAITYQGQLQELARNRKAARASFEQALAINPRNATALKEYGSLLISSGQGDTGLNYLHKAAEIEPYDVKVQWELCGAYAFMGDSEGTARECNRIAEIQPGNPMQAYGQSFLYQFKGELAKAIFWDMKAIEMDPGDHELPASIAMNWTDLGDMKQADAWLQKAAQLAPNQPVTVSARILTLMRKEQYQQALQLAHKAHDEGLPARMNSTRTVNRLLVGEAIQKRNFDLALELLLEYFPDGLSGALETDSPRDIGELASIAQVLNMQNPGSEQATALIDHAESLLLQSDNRWIPFAEGIRTAAIEAARGNKPATITGLQLAYDRGWRTDWHAVLHDDFRFEFLHQEPEYQQLVALFEQDMERQRIEAYELLGIRQ